MGSSAFELLIVPVCQGVCLGLIFGLVIQQALKWISVRLDGSASAPEEFYGFGQAPTQAKQASNPRRAPSRLEGPFVANP
jgi:hypothetical protein